MKKIQINKKRTQKLICVHTRWKTDKYKQHPKLFSPNNEHEFLTFIMTISIYQVQLECMYTHTCTHTLMLETDIYFPPPYIKLPILI